MRKLGDLEFSEDFSDDQILDELSGQMSRELKLLEKEQLWFEGGECQLSPANVKYNIDKLQGRIVDIQNYIKKLASEEAKNPESLDLFLCQHFYGDFGWPDLFTLGSASTRWSSSSLVPVYFRFNGVAAGTRWSEHHERGETMENFYLLRYLKRG